MTTLAERDTSSGVVNAVKNTPQFKRASKIYRNFFTGAGDLANQVLADKWLLGDLEIILGVLASWYSEERN